MLFCGATQDEVAAYMGINDNTLRKHYPDEIKDAVLEANTAVAGTLYSKAISGDVASMIFWLKCRARWKHAADDEGDKGDAKKQGLSPEVAEKLIESYIQKDNDLKRLVTKTQDGGGDGIGS